MHTVVEMEQFIASAKKSRITKAERLAIVSHLARHPKAGEVIKGTGGARKLRWRARGRGKRSGYRIITFYSGRDLPVFLIDIFAKNEKIDLSMRERNNLRKTLGAIKVAYRGKSR